MAIDRALDGSCNQGKEAAVVGCRSRCDSRLKFCAADSALSTQTIIFALALSKSLNRHEIRLGLDFKNQERRLRTYPYLPSIFRHSVNIRV
jgi:hypothetical protein